MYGIYFLCYKQTVQDVMQFLYNVVVTNVLIGLYITFYIKSKHAPFATVSPLTPLNFWR